MVEIGRTRRVKRVSWAPGLSLCQVRLFLSEDAPCQSGLSSQDHLQAKNSWSSANSTASDDSSSSLLPPGFETVHNQKFHNHPKSDISKIPLIRWKCPPKIVLNPEWYVVAGGESQEIAKQNERNIAVLEAIYPRQSTIPPNPSVSAEALESSSCPDDSSISTVPLTAIEELEDTEPSSDPSNSHKIHSDHNTPVASSHSHQPNSNSHPTNVTPIPPTNLPEMSLMLSRLGGAHADVAAAAAAAITAVTSAAEQGNLIDQDLLIKILSDPSLVGLLVPDNNNRHIIIPQPLPSQHSTAHLFNRNNNINDPNPGTIRNVVIPTTASCPVQPLHNHNAQLYNATANNNNNNNTIPRPPQSMVTSTVSAPIPSPPPLPPFLPPFNNVRPNMINPVATPPPPPSQPQIIPPAIRPLPGVNPGKDPNYYKTLIKQHGGEIIGNINPDVAGIGQQNGVSDGGTNHQKVKTCAFFNTARGCKHGDSCFFIHDNNSSVNKRERARKRVKR